MSLAILDKPQPVVIDEKLKADLMALVNALNAEPGENEVKVRHDGVKYVPIEIVEAKLNQFFGGLWQTYNFKYTVIVNEIVGDLELAIYNPTAGVWLRRVGTGAVIIQQKAEYEMDDKGKRVKKANDFLDINRKIANTLEKDMGHLKADCIKNAAKSLGAAFGANILRKIEDGDYAADQMKDPDTVEKEMQDITTKKDLIAYYNSLSSVVKSDKRVKNVLKRRQLEIENLPKEEK